MKFVCFSFLISFSLINSLSFAKVNTEFTKTTLGRGSNKKHSKMTSTKKRRKLYLNFASAKSRSQETETTENTYASEATTNSATSGGATAAPLTPKKIGFSNEFQLGFSNSAYRYAGEQYPSQSVDFGLVPSFETTCFSIKCIYLAKILGGFDLNNHGKNELAMIQLGLKIPGDPWGGYLTPGYSVLGYLPATPKDINDDHMTFGYGGAFSLATTPELMGTEFIAFTGTVSLRKNEYQSPITNQTNWTTRQALVTDLNFTKTIGATFVFGHIWSESHDGTNKEILELIQSIKWAATDWLELNLGHSNIGPLVTAEGSRLDPSLVSIDNSVISFGVTFSNSF